jgi:hypothetical protein
MLAAISNDDVVLTSPFRKKKYRTTVSSNFRSSSTIFADRTDFPAPAYIYINIVLKAMKQNEDVHTGNTHHPKII